MNDNNKKIIKTSVLAISVFAIILSVTYAFINITLQGEKKQVITAGNLDLVLDEDENNLTITDALPMYDEVGMMQDAFTFRIINNTTTDTNYILKLTDITTGDALDKTIVKYGLTKNGVGEPALLSTLPDDGTVDSGTIGNKETIEYSLRLWIDSSVTDNSVISGKSLSYRVDLEMSQEIQKYPSSIVFDTATTNVGENCKTYDDGIDTFLVGQCSNNYVWYSGKLWRIVLKNNATGAIKMVTDNAITVIPYNASGNTTFKDSYMDQWLNQEFLLTLHDVSKYLVENSIWDATQDSSSTPLRPNGTTTLERTVGSLNNYEFYTSYNKSDGLATFRNGYLVNGAWWSITPDSEKYATYISNIMAWKRPNEGYGVRPAVNLKANVQIDSGTGTLSDPYILKGDTQETINGTTLLSTRYSGEYVTFNNELYRIVDKEMINGETLTKITAVDKPSALESNDFYSATGVEITFAESDIKTDLENYYKGLATTNETAYNMIQPSTLWYLGVISNGAYHYKASICAIVDPDISMNKCAEKAVSTTANIGLPRLGEMFTSQITRRIKGTAVQFWTLTPVASAVAWYTSINYTGNLSKINNPTLTYGARPSMYLKSNVVIASDNTGNGTYEKPYTLE